MTRKKLSKTAEQWLGSFREELDLAIADSKTVLDVGCGSNSPLSLLGKRFVRSVGVDGFAPSLEMSAAKKIHDEYVQANILELDSKFQPNSFDCTMAIDVIEHLEKSQGLEFIQQMEQIASNRIVLVTPNGFQPQAEHSGNLYQRHLSGWTAEEMRGMGYKVIGLNGWKPLRGEFAMPRFYPKILCSALSRLSQPLVRNHPEHAFHLLCIKEKS
jgi:cyclopropane fatty-acyl-phospholipid synthase-like methyltransferase